MDENNSSKTLQFARIMAASTYPCEPKEKTKACREHYLFDYSKLLSEGLLPYHPLNDFETLRGIKLGIIYYDYFGQIDKETGSKPEGVGVAVSTDNSFKKSIIVEGGFKDGK